MEAPETSRLLEPKHLESAIAAEFEGADLPDLRLNSRLDTIVRGLTRSPDVSFPRAVASEAELEGFYRFVSNDRIDPKSLAEPHLAASVERACERKEAICVHDTTMFSFGHLDNELGPLPSKKRGFLAHCSLLLRDEQSRLPLGLGTILPWRRSDASKTRDSSGRKISSRRIAARHNKETARWFRSIERVEERVAGRTSIVHVADREADFFELIAQVGTAGRRFVFRIGRDRYLDSEKERQRLAAALAEAPVICTREVGLSKRRQPIEPKSAKLYPARPKRSATLAVSAVSEVRIVRPAQRRDLPESTLINVVWVREVDPPEGEKPVDWLLATSERVEFAEDLLRVVDLYRSRWVVEEFFKALKTGCRYKDRLQQSYEGLLRVLALFLPIAWQMLHLRQLPREHPDLPASLFLAPLQLTVLRAVAATPLSDAPTIQEAANAIARMGGHLKRNGPPGWLTLARGQEALAGSVAGWLACKATLGGSG